MRIRSTLLMVASLGLGGKALEAQICSEHWTLDETLRIGSLSGEDALSNVSALTVGPTGLIYLGQQNVAAITVFESEGRPSHRIGRAGSGPGEFEGAPAALGWRGDTLWAYDHAALSFFGPDGRPEGQVYFRTFVPDQGYVVTPGVPLSDGSILGRRVATSAGSGGLATYFTADSLPLVKVTRGGEIVGNLGYVQNEMHVGIPTDYGTGYAIHPLAGEDYAVALDGSSVLMLGPVEARGEGATFEIRRIGPNGEVLLQRAVRFQPKELSRSDRRWLTEEFGKVLAGDYDADSPSQLFGRDDAARERDRRAAQEAIEFPDYMPPVRRILAGEDGSIWLLRELDLPDLVDRWQVYSEEGEFEAEVTVASGRGSRSPWGPRLRVLRASREEVWGTTLGDFDEPYVHRYAVDRGCG